MHWQPEDEVLSHENQKTYIHHTMRQSHHLIDFLLELFLYLSKIDYESIHLGKYSTVLWTGTITLTKQSIHLLYKSLYSANIHNSSLPHTTKVTKSPLSY